MFGKLLFSAVSYMLLNSYIDPNTWMKYLPQLTTVAIFYGLKNIQMSLVQGVFLLIRSLLIMSLIISLGQTTLLNYGYELPSWSTYFIYLTSIYIAIFGWRIVMDAGLVFKEIIVNLFKMIFQKGYKRPSVKAKDMQAIDALGNNGRDFEDYIAQLYRDKGYDAKTTMELKEENNLPPCIMNSPGNGEQGADVIVFFDTPEDWKGESFDGLLIQCKQYSSTVGNKAVQEPIAGLAIYNEHFKRKLRPVVITNNNFTRSAINLARANKVELIDRELLSDMVA